VINLVKQKTVKRKRKASARQVWYLLTVLSGIRLVFVFGCLFFLDSFIFFVPGKRFFLIPSGTGKAND